jgi:predicted MFS family arabinose efflux permease
MLVIGLLILINIVNFIDRLLPSILIQAIKLDLHLTDAQIGLMSGLSFAVVYSFAAIPLAHIADRWSPRALLAITLGFWSLMTAASGLAQGFGSLIAARAGVAAGEAGCTPVAHALISRSFARHQRAFVLGLFSLGVPIGSMIGLSLGGWISDLFNWRVAFFVVGGPGLVLALLSTFLLPRLPAARDGGGSGEFWSGLRYLFALKSFRHMAAGSALYACGSYAMNVFAAAFLIRVHHLTTAQAGLGFGLAFGIGGLAGTYLGGLLGDRLAKRDARWWQLVPAIGQLLSFPAAIGAWLVPDATLSIVLIGFAYVFGLLYLAPTFASAQSLAPEDKRATASAVLLFCLTLVGSSVGPVVVGWASDLLTPQFGALSLRYAMCLMGVTILWSAWHYYRAAEALPADLARISGPTH